MRKAACQFPDVVHIDQPYWYGEGGDMDPAEFGRARARQLEDTIDRLGEDNVAAFIAEPIQGAGAVIIPPETYWPEIQRICDEREILLIADEVICGFGRTGKWFGSDTYNIRPDIMTIAKGMSSGYLPIAGSVIREDVARTFEDQAGEFVHGYTYSGHPVSAAVALENIRLLDEEGIVTRAGAEVAPYLAQKWATLADHQLVGEARTKGVLGALELSPDPANRAPFKSATGTVGLIAREFAFETGLVMRHVRDTLIISPPLIITKSEIDLLVARAHEVLDKTLAHIKANGIA